MTLAVATKGPGNGRPNLAGIYKLEIYTAAENMRSSNIGAQVMGEIEFKRLEYRIETYPGLTSSERKELLGILEKEKTKAESSLKNFWDKIATIAEKDARDAQRTHSEWPYIHRD